MYLSIPLTLGIVCYENFEEEPRGFCTEEWSYHTAGRDRRV
jgi:hypothetical protein